MYWPGHVGAALLAYAPVGALVSARYGTPLAAVGTAVAVGLSTLPDADQVLPIDHRGPTHTIWFAFLVTAVAALGGGALGATGVLPPALGPPLLFALVVGTATVVAIGSHLAADSITPMGIAPLVPIVAWHHSFELTRAANSTANRVLFACGILVTVVVHAVVGA